MTEIVGSSKLGSNQMHRVRRAAGCIAPGLLLAGLFVTVVFLTPAQSRAADVGISVQFGPPPLPIYDQPPCPDPDYIWTPGYWAYDQDEGYYWVPGTWVTAPEPGLLWTPGYWGWEGSAFLWHSGYWGTQVGFYGGIDYGFGYPGEGFVGGEWRGHDFYYNRAVNNIGRTRIDHVYDRHVNDFHGNRVSYNGGPAGIQARPHGNEISAEHERHFEATNLQRQNAVTARGNRPQFASVNRGRPDVAAVPKAGEFRGSNVVRASRPGGPLKPEQLRAPGGNSVHPAARNPHEGGGVQANPPRHETPAPPAKGTNRVERAPTPFHPAQPSHSESPHGNASAHPERRAPKPIQPAPPAHTENPHASSPRETPHSEQPRVTAPRPAERPRNAPEAPVQHAAPERHAPPATERHAPEQHAQPQHAPAEHPQAQPHRPAEHQQPGH